MVRDERDCPFNGGYYVGSGTRDEEIECVAVFVSWKFDVLTEVSGIKGGEKC